MPKILFICTANICRSPMAAALLRQQINSKLDGHEWQIGSAGTWALDGQPASGIVQEILSQRGIDISNHRSRSVTQILSSSADLILAMEKGQVEALRVEFPAARDRIFLLSEMVGRQYEIKDPYGSSREAFLETLEEIELILIQGFDRIVEVARANANR